MTTSCPDRLRGVRSSAEALAAIIKRNAKRLIFATGFGRWLLRRLRLGIRRRGGLGFARFFFGRFLVFVATIIRNVEPRALEDETAPAANQFFHASLAPFLHAAQLFRANRDRFVIHRLNELKAMIALFTTILVSRHANSLIGAPTSRVKVFAPRLTQRPKPRKPFRYLPVIGYHAGDEREFESGFAAG